MATLLSGWKIHLTDEAGFPLYPGRVQFFDALTSLPKAVYTTKELTTPLGVVVDTDAQGNLPAIWLSEGRYKAIVQKKVVEDPEEWNPLWTINDLGEGAAASPAGSGVLAYCRNIPEMRAIPAGTVDAFIVAGYYNPGDCGDPMFFTYEQASTRTDDSGAFIRPNDTGAGTPGRYHQVFGNILDIRKWGGIPNDESVDCIGALTNMSNYAISATNFPDGAPRIGFPGTGNYRFSGPITFDAIWQNLSHTSSAPVEYFVGNDVQFCSMTEITHTVNFVNAVIIESESKLTPFNTATFEAGSVPYIRPQWYAHPSMVSKIALALANGNGIPVKAYGTGCTGNTAVSNTYPIVWEGAHLTLDMVGWYMTLATGASITITCPMTVTANDYIFRGDGDVSIGGDNQINARWFGWGILSGNQGVPLQKAIDALANSIPILVPYSSGSITSTVSRSGEILPFIQPTSVINLYGTGRLLYVGIIADFSKQIFNNTGTGVLALYAESISPYWFGASASSVDGLVNDRALTQAIATAILMSTPINGGGRTLYISTTLLPVLMSNTILNISNVTLSAAPSWNVGTNPWMVTITSSDGGGDLIMDKVVINPTLTTGLRAMSASTYYQRVANCFFGNDITVQGNDYVYSTNQQYGTTASCNFHSATVSGIVSNNSFSGSMVYFVGETQVTGGRSYKYLENIIFTNNSVANINSAASYGRVSLYTRAVNTVVKGVVILGNTFKGHIAGSSQTQRMRITAEGYVADVSTWCTMEDIPHRLVIKDNILNDGLESSSTRNIVPSTSGTVIAGVNIVSPVTTYINFAGPGDDPNNTQADDHTTLGAIVSQSFTTNLQWYNGIFLLPNTTQPYNSYVMVPSFAVMHVVANPPPGAGMPDVDEMRTVSANVSVAPLYSGITSNTDSTCEVIRSNACNIPLQGTYVQTNNGYTWYETADWNSVYFAITYNIYEAQ